MPRDTTILQKSDLACLTVVLMWYVWFTASLIPVAAEDIRMAGVFSIDEADITAEVLRLYRVGLLAQPSFKYGSLYYYIPLIFLKVVGIVVPISEQMLIWTMRAFGTAAGVGCIWMTWMVGKRVFSNVVGQIAAVFLAVNLTVLRWSVESHPDLPQLFFLVAGLYFAVRASQEATVRNALIAAVFAGFAFGTKYSGLFLIPVIALAVLLAGSTQGRWLDRFKDRFRWTAWILVPVVFFAIIAATNPYALLHFQEFRESLMAEQEILSFGHSFRADPSGFLWVQNLLGLAGTIHVVAAIGFLLWTIRVSVGAKEIPRETVVVVAWVVIFVGYLMFEIHLRRARHLLPILPFVLLLAGACYQTVWGTIRSTRVGNVAWIVPVILLVFLIRDVQGTIGFQEERRSREVDSVELVVGRMLAEQMPADTSILFDTYSYIPAKFPLVFRSVGMSYALVTHFEPDILVIRDAIARDYADMEQAKNARRGEESYLDRYYFYRYLREERLPDYRLIDDLGKVAIYRRSASRVRTGEDEESRWKRLHKRYMDRKMYGKVQAHQTMGSIHLSLGQEAQAEKEFARARESTNFAKRVFTHGIRELKKGRMREAESAFREALEASAGESPKYRAQMRVYLARGYSQARDHEKAVEHAMAALELDPTMEEAREIIDDE